MQTRSRKPHLHILCCCALLIAVVPTLHAQRRVPVALTAEQNDLVNSGIKLHDAGDFAQAIDTYRGVLVANPHAVDALYEISLTFLVAGRPDSAVVYARRGIEYASELYPLFCINLGNALDTLGDSKGAVAVYRKGLVRAPDMAMLHFNLGVTYARHGDMAAAKASVQRAIQLQPNHPGSHNALATIYASLGERVPALLAAMRFLVLEPVGPRARAAASLIEAFWKHGVTRDDSNHISVKVPMGPGERGEFSAAEMYLGLMGAYELVDTSRKSPEEKMVKRYGDFIAVLDADPSDTSEKERLPGFLRAYYVRYFAEMMAHDFAEPFAYVLHATDGNPAVDAWLQEHGDRLEALLTWSKGYEWPAPPTK